MRSTKRQQGAPEHIARTIGAIPYREFDDGPVMAEQREVLIAEYLAKKAVLIANAPEDEQGRKVSAQMLAKMTGREAAGMFFRVYGANALRAFNAMMDRTARRRYEKTFPGVGDLLRRHCPEGRA